MDTTTTTMDTTTEPKPADYEHGHGELIRAYRLYIGLNQREMALKLNKARRDYQRIESDQDACPPGLLTKIEQLVTEFDDLVGRIIDAAESTENGHVNIAMDAGPGGEWERLASGRAAVIVADDPELPSITLTMSGNTPRERSA